MNKYPWWKYAFILAVLLFGVLYSVPNLFPDEVAVQVSARSGTPVDQKIIDNLKQLLTTHSITYKSMEPGAKGYLLIRFNSAEDQLKADDLIRAALGEDYTVALNLASTTPDWLSAIGADPMKLGLDLRGGVHFLLAVDVDTLLKTRQNGNLRGLGAELRHAMIRYRDLTLGPNNSIVLNFRDEASQDKAAALMRQSYPDLTIKTYTNLDGYGITAQLSQQAVLAAQDAAIEQTTDVLRKRINALGIAEPVVQRQGAERISVDLPGVQDTARAKLILGGTATLEFHLVDTEHDAADTGNVPLGSKLYRFENMPVLLKNQSILSGSSITNAASNIGQDGRPSVDIRLGGGGEATFYRITGENIGKPLATVYIETLMQPTMVDGKSSFVPRKTERIINIATIQSALPSSFQITGIKDAKEALDLALLLKSGALPAPISIIAESTLGPSLGRANIDKGILSLEVGMVFIILFMVIYYRVFGLLADLALVFNLVLLVAVLSILGMTLTLPGMAGIVLTVGMAIDANVLIFERIREELRNGLSPQAAIKAGYERAFSTIVDSNVTTLIAAVALYGVGSGSIRGFALTLSIGLICSMFTAITGSRALVNLIYGSRHVKKLSIGI
jgi:preprotein translocase subunit SecD